MKNENDYLDMQKTIYNIYADRWSLNHRDPVVGSYDKHNVWKDYQKYLFKDLETEGKIALEYGAGPGRNLILFKDRFERIDGVDISEGNKQKAKINTEANDVEQNYNYYVCDGKSIPCESETYDFIFSVITLQHICCYSIRYQILQDCYRVLKPGGYMCFQMGYGGKPRRNNWRKYHVNEYGAQGTNGRMDVSITDENDLKKDLFEIGFKTFDFDIRPVGPGDDHANWIFIRTQK